MFGAPKSGFIDVLQQKRHGSNRTGGHKGQVIKFYAQGSGLQGNLQAKRIAVSSHQGSRPLKMQNNLQRPDEYEFQIHNVLLDNASNGQQQLDSGAQSLRFQQQQAQANIASSKVYQNLQERDQKQGRAQRTEILQKYLKRKRESKQLSQHQVQLLADQAGERQFSSQA